MTGRPAPMVVRLASMCSYFYVFRLGVFCLVMPWAEQTSPEVAASTARAGILYVLQYLVESSLAWRGVLTLHAWRADELLKHHLTVGFVFLPSCVCCALRMPVAWEAMLQSHPPAVAVISSACMTGLNEGCFAVRSFLPLHIADAPSIRWFQSCCTLAALLQNVLLTQVGCLLGAYTLLSELVSCAVGQGDVQCTRSRTLLSVALVMTYTAGPLFFVLVQAHYLPANVRRVVYMTDFAKRDQRMRSRG